MSREIKFRGKRIDNGEWETGYLINDSTINKKGRRFSVIAPTIGQYTGLKDKNVVEIYEGDKVRGKAYAENGIIEGVVTWYEDRWVVQYNNGLRISLIYFKWIEVIGNIYEAGDSLEARDDV